MGADLRAAYGRGVGKRGVDDGWMEVRNIPIEMSHSHGGVIFKYNTATASRGRFFSYLGRELLLSDAHDDA